MACWSIAVALKRAANSAHPVTCEKHTRPGPLRRPTETSSGLATYILNPSGDSDDTVLRTTAHQLIKKSH